MAKTLACRVGLHRWVKRSTEDGSTYRVCGRCGKDDPRGRPHWSAGMG